jgi:LuxR family transcriptional regulator, maltose regulon positive regulatory protein
MSRKLPCIDTVGAAGLTDEGQPGVYIEVDSVAWFEWLEAAETRRFTYALEDAGRGYIVGWMTVRKEERERGGRYWVAYRRMGGRLRKVYLGKSGEVTGARLKEVAEQLRGPSESDVERES